MEPEKDLTNTPEPEGEPGADGRDPQDAQPDNAVVDFTKDPAIAAFIELKVQEGIQKALKGKSPRANTTKATEQEYKNFDKMSYKERLKLYTSDPLTYNKLAKGAM